MVLTTNCFCTNKYKFQLISDPKKKKTKSKDKIRAVMKRRKKKSTI